MPDMTATLGLDSKRMSRRLNFLQLRARSHDMLAASTADNARARLHLACAATLRRDAASIAMLLGDLRKARIELALAGTIWLQLGLAYGAFLMRVGDPHSIGGPRMFKGVSEDFAGSEQKMAFKDEEWWFSILSKSRHPRQLLSIIQASVGNPEIAQFESIARDRLSSYRGLPIGTAGLSLGRYIDLLDEVQLGDLGARGRETLISVAISRRDMIEAAREDKYHWLRMQQPAELVDFNLLALGLASLVGGETVDGEIQTIMNERGPAAWLPFALARQLNDIGPEKFA